MWGYGGWGGGVTCVYKAQTVAAKVEQLEVFGQQELFGPEMFDTVTGHIHLHYVRWQVSWDVIQICKGRKMYKHKVFNSERTWQVECLEERESLGEKAHCPLKV